MKTYKISFNMIVWVLSLLALGCKKEDKFLTAKPDQSLTVPATLNDLQLLLKNETVFNRNYPSLGEASTDDVMLDASALANDVPVDRNVYLWAAQLYPAGTIVNDWNYPYQMIYYANSILTQLPKISTDSQSDLYKGIQGAALFYRAVAIYNLVQLFAIPYNRATANVDLGIPLRITPDLTQSVSRGTMEECYSFMIKDLNAALELLPATSTSPLMPSQAAVEGLLARIYLVMEDYPGAQKHAGEALRLVPRLQDLNKLTIGARIVYPSFSPEELFHAGMLNYLSVGKTSQVGSDLYKLFDDPNDLRLKIYFRTAGGLNYFNSQYDLRNLVTYSISTAEMYLTKAECEARANDVPSAMTDLNKLLVSRWKAGTFKPLTAISQDAALQIILKERRKELALTGLRWTDLKRLNKDPKYAVTLTRNVNGLLYTLPPNDPRYALSIPDNEIQFNPIPQNPR